MPAGAPRCRRPLRLALLLAGAALLLDALVVEPAWLEVTRHQVAAPGLPAALDGLRVVQISDLHFGPTTGEADIARAVRTCNRLRPDLVVLTGDYVHDPARRGPKLTELLRGLAAPLGVYAVPGNHDHWQGTEAVMGSLTAAGIHDLTNASVRVAPGLRLAGVDDVWVGRPDLARAVRDRQPGEALLLLSHSPAVLHRAVQMGLEAVCLTGHTHGGQVCLPFIPRNRLPGVRRFRYVSGWYRDGRIRMYVNRGIGTVIVRARFLCRPEVSLFVLRSITKLTPPPTKSSKR